jgi:hypothetical protein
MKKLFRIIALIMQKNDEINYYNDKFKELSNKVDYYEYLISENEYRNKKEIAFNGAVQRQLDILADELSFKRIEKEEQFKKNWNNLKTK